MSVERLRMVIRPALVWVTGGTGTEMKWVHLLFAGFLSPRCEVSQKCQDSSRACLWTGWGG